MVRKAIIIKKGLLLAFFVLLITTLTSLTINNIKLKNNLEALQNPIIIPDHDFGNGSFQDNPQVKIVLNGEKGPWDKEGKTKLVLINELTIESDEQNPEQMFYHASPIKADVYGNIYVEEVENGTIKKFSPQGDYLFTIGRKGRGPGEFFGTFNFLFEKDTILTVFDINRISRFNCKTGRFLGSIPITGNIKHSMRIEDCVIDEDGNYYVSFYDYDTDNVIHKISEDGRYLGSFGEPFATKDPYGQISMILKKGFAAGKLFYKDKPIFFSRFTPYDIRIYHSDGTQKMKIARKNDFMSPAKVEITGNNRYRIGRPPAQSLMLGMWQDMLINCVAFLPEAKSKFGAIIDVFNFNGQLLTSITIKENIAFNYIDHQGKMYGEAIDDDFVERIVRYRLKIQD